MCLQANQHNALTSYYHLLDLKLRIYEQNEIVPVESQVKKYQSIEPTRSNLDKKRVNKLSKQPEGVNLTQVKPPSLAGEGTGGQVSINCSPDLMLVQGHELTQLISPTFAHDDHPMLRQSRNVANRTSVTLQDKLPNNDYFSPKESTSLNSTANKAFKFKKPNPPRQQYSRLGAKKSMENKSGSFEQR